MSDVMIACHFFLFNFSVLNYYYGTASNDGDHVLFRLWVFYSVQVWAYSRNRQKLKTCTGLLSINGEVAYFMSNWMMMMSIEIWNWFRGICAIVSRNKKRQEVLQAGGEFDDERVCLFAQIWTLSLSTASTFDVLNSLFERISMHVKHCKILINANWAVFYAFSSMKISN